MTGGSWVDDLAAASLGVAANRYGLPRPAPAGVTRASVLRAVMSALPEAEQWAAEVEALGGAPSERVVVMVAALQARAVRVTGLRDQGRDMVDEVRSLVAEAAVLLVELGGGS